VRRQDKAASGAQNVVCLWFVCADLWVWIFDRLHNLTAVLATEFHASHFIAALLWILFRTTIWVILAAMNRLAALILVAFLPMIAAGKGGYSSASHSTATHSRSKVATAAHSRKSTVAVRKSHGKIARSASAKRSFQASSPCPSTGRTTGGCKGYVIDHKTPLACGGADSPENMQWQTSSEAKLKDRTERAGCR
jgi:hypothetical protein